MSETSKPKKSSVRHTRAIQRDRTKRPNSAPPDEQIEARLTELIHPATSAQVATFHAMGLRERILTLPVMLAFVLSLIWRHLGSVSDATRVLREEGLLWARAQQVTQAAVEQRLRGLPPLLFQRVLLALLPRMRARWRTRQRPLAPALAWAERHFTAVLALDGSTLDGLLRKVGLLRDGEGPVLAGRMAALLDLISQLPRQVWYEEDWHAHDQRFWERVLSHLTRGMLLIFDLGVLNYARFDQLTEQGVFFLTRTTTTIAARTEQVLRAKEDLRDRLVWVGSGSESCCQHLLRMVEVRYAGKW